MSIAMEEAKTDSPAMRSSGATCSGMDLKRASHKLHTPFAWWFNESVECPFPSMIQIPLPVGIQTSSMLDNGGPVKVPEKDATHKADDV